MINHVSTIKSNMMDRRSLAKYGESLAAAYLGKNGYKILEKNFNSHYGEIDIVAIDSNTLVFVEVKTRYSFEFGKPEESITKRKLYLVGRTGQYYKLTHEGVPDLLRIDAVLIEINGEGKTTRLELIKNAEIP